MTREQWAALTAEQREAFHRIVDRSGQPLDRMIRNAYAPSGLCPYVGIPDFHGMFVGIEPDGYTHT